ncbi:MAG: hypothetical protein HC780_27275 [Leptolyngbyaceae cyanobacterium CSU_1_3]|nr:hypothetical protein [Leptolyngbyaceae cyanobacterium CSU_1_3]
MAKYDRDRSLKYCLLFGRSQVSIDSGAIANSQTGDRSIGKAAVSDADSIDAGIKLAQLYTDSNHRIQVCLNEEAWDDRTSNT